MSAIGNPDLLLSGEEPVQPADRRQLNAVDSPGTTLSFIDTR